MTLCGFCTRNTDCQSGYCDRANQQCNTANPCTSATDCGGLTCDAASGNCQCPSGSSSTSGSSGSSGTH
jgi:hypothetical protein